MQAHSYFATPGHAQRTCHVYIIGLKAAVKRCGGNHSPYMEKNEVADVCEHRKW